MTRTDRHDLHPDVQQLRRYVAARGACATDPDPDAFVVRDPVRNTMAAIRGCAVCPVRAECHDLAVLIDAPLGVWGGVWFGAHGPTRRGMQHDDDDRIDA